MTVEPTLQLGRGPGDSAAPRDPSPRSPPRSGKAGPMGFGGMTGYRLSSTACVVTQYLASMLAFSHFGSDAGSFR